MRRFIFALVAVATIAVMASCKRNVIDPVNDVTPVDTSFWAGNVVTSQGDTVAATVNSRFDLYAFQALGQKGGIDGMRKMVDKHRTELTANVVAHFPELKHPDSIRFELWTGAVQNVLSGDGSRYSGNIQNELVFHIKEAPVDTLVFLACGNGMLSDVSELGQGLTRIDFGTATPWLFVIERGQGLANHLSSLQDWVRVAKNFPVPIKDEKGKIVSPDVCLKNYGTWTTALFTGDTIDMVRCEVRNSHGRVDFERRQLETQKANAKAKTRAKSKRNRRR